MKPTREMTASKNPSSTSSSSPSIVLVATLASPASAAARSAKPRMSSEMSVASTLPWARLCAPRQASGPLHRRRRRAHDCPGRRVPYPAWPRSLRQAMPQASDPTDTRGPPLSATALGLSACRQSGRTSSYSREPPICSRFFDPAAEVVLGHLVEQLGMVSAHVIADPSDHLVLGVSARDISALAVDLLGHVDLLVPRFVELKPWAYVGASLSDRVRIQLCGMVT